MMQVLCSGVLFLVGFYLGIRVIAAMYLPLDLWYTIRTAWPRVLRNLLVWAGCTLVIAALLNQVLRNAFIIGFAAFVLYYLFSKIVVSRLIIHLLFKYRRPTVIE